MGGGGGWGGGGGEGGSGGYQVNIFSYFCTKTYVVVLIRSPSALDEKTFENCGQMNGWMMDGK